jgi:hypothetical protein
VITEAAILALEIPRRQRRSIAPIDWDVVSGQVTDRRRGYVLVRTDRESWRLGWTPEVAALMVKVDGLAGSQVTVDTDHHNEITFRHIDYVV